MVKSGRRVRGLKSSTPADSSKERAKWRSRLLRQVNLLLQKKIYVFDIDGTVIVGDSPVDGAREFVELISSLGKRMVFLTNNTSLTSSQHLQRIVQILEIPRDDVSVYSALDFLASELTRRRIERIYVLFNQVVTDELIKKGFIIDDRNPQVVIVGFDTELTYGKLKKACALVEKGIPWILAHPDLRCPVTGGYVPDAGSIGLVMSNVTGIRPMFVGGKPDPQMLLSVLKMLKVKRSDVCFFGDRVYTDAAMGLRSGIKTILLLTGESRFKDLVRFCKENNCHDLVLLGENWIFLSRAFLRSPTLPKTVHRAAGGHCQ